MEQRSKESRGQRPPPGQAEAAMALAGDIGRAVGELGCWLSASKRAAAIACLRRTLIGVEHPADCLCRGNGALLRAWYEEEEGGGR